MPKKIDYSVTDDELQELEKAIKKDKDLRLRERARIIRLLHLRQSPKEVSELLAISVGQVYGWHKRWKAEGLAGLSDRPKSGRPLVSTSEVEAEIEKLLECDPQELGYVFTVWNAGRLRAYLAEKLGIEMHENTVRNTLSRLEYRYRKPKHDLESLQNLEAKAKAKEELDALKKKPAPKKSNYSLWTKQP